MVLMGASWPPALRRASVCFASLQLGNRRRESGEGQTEAEISILIQNRECLRQILKTVTSFYTSIDKLNTI